MISRKRAGRRRLSARLYNVLISTVLFGTRPGRAMLAPSGSGSGALQRPITVALLGLIPANEPLREAFSQAGLALESSTGSTGAAAAVIDLSASDREELVALARQCYGPLVGILPADADAHIADGLDGFVRAPYAAADLPPLLRALARARRDRDEMLRQTQDLAALLDVTRTFAASGDTDPLLFEVVEKLAGRLTVERCSMVLVDPQRGTGWVVAASDDAMVRELRIDLSSYPEIREVLQTRKPLVIDDARRHPLLDPVREAVDKQGISAVAVVPMVSEGDVVGVLFLRAMARSAFAPREIGFLSIVANATAVALRNARRAAAGVERVRGADPVAARPRDPELPRRDRAARHRGRAAQDEGLPRAAHRRDRGRHRRGGPARPHPPLEQGGRARDRLFRRGSGGKDVGRRRVPSWAGARDHGSAARGEPWRGADPAAGRGSGGEERRGDSRPSLGGALDRERARDGDGGRVQRSAAPAARRGRAPGGPGQARPGGEGKGRLRAGRRRGARAEPAVDEHPGLFRAALPALQGRRSWQGRAGADPPRGRTHGLDRPQDRQDRPLRDDGVRRQPPHRRPGTLLRASSSSRSHRNQGLGKKRYRERGRLGSAGARERAPRVG